MGRLMGRWSAWIQDREAGLSVRVVEDRRHCPARVAAAREREMLADEERCGWLRVSTVLGKPRGEPLANGCGPHAVTHYDTRIMRTHAT